MEPEDHAVVEILQCSHCKIRYKSAYGLQVMNCHSMVPGPSVILVPFLLRQCAMSVPRGSSCDARTHLAVHLRVRAPEASPSSASLLSHLWLEVLPDSSLPSSAYPTPCSQSLTFFQLHLEASRHRLVITQQVPGPR